MIDIVETMEILSQTRPLFHSEADFQHSLAWQIHLQNPSFDLRLEHPLSIDSDESGQLDILVHFKDRELVIELKYKKALCWTRRNDEVFMLKKDNAEDISRYDFLKDVQRIEKRVSERAYSEGYAILLTNDKLYWKSPTKSGNSEQFFVNEGREIKGALNWAPNAGKGTTKNRPSPITLRNKYNCKWRNYSNFTSDKGSGEFRYLLFKISK